eukprot:m.49062 g.49062  ORF g.49062 m.49062 type:complete len:138 (+) comp10596_c1_seq1:249-662(+)
MMLTKRSILCLLLVYVVPSTSSKNEIKYMVYKNDTNCSEKNPLFSSLEISECAPFGEVFVNVTGPSECVEEVTYKISTFRDAKCTDEDSSEITVVTGKCYQTATAQDSYMAECAAAGQLRPILSLVFCLLSSGIMLF